MLPSCFLRIRQKKRMDPQKREAFASLGLLAFYQQAIPVKCLDIGTDLFSVCSL